MRIQWDDPCKTWLILLWWRAKRPWLDQARTNWLPWLADDFTRRSALPEIKCTLYLLFLSKSGASEIPWNLRRWVWTLEVNVELERWTDSPVLHRLVVEYRLWVLRKWEEEFLELWVDFWRGAGHGNSGYERRISFNWAVIGPAGEQRGGRTSFFYLNNFPWRGTEKLF